MATSWNIADLVEACVDAVPDREALVAGAARRTYAELDARANRVAHHLAEAGVSQGEHVGIHAYNCAEFLETMLGCYKLRAVPININYRYVEQELHYLFDNADLVALVHQRRFAPRIAAIRGRLPKLRHFVALDDASGEDLSALGSVLYEDALAKSSPERGFGPRSGDDLYILYTGGTTGMPKGVVWRQEDVIFALGGGIDHATGVPCQSPADLTAKTANPPMVMMALAPLMHGAAQWGSMNALFVGNKIVLYSHEHFDADLVWELVEHERVNVMSLTGDAMARPLVEALETLGGRCDVSSLVALASTAAIFSPSVKVQFKKRLPNLIITDSVGSSEGGFNGTAMYQPDAPKREGAGVSVRPGRDTLVIDEDGKPVAPGSGVIGKLARGGNIPQGYYKDPEKTAATFVSVQGRRYAVPGDFAKVEEDGSITLLGRGSVCINSGGEKIYPEEVEAALKSHPDVFDAVVVGIPDARWGERVAAVLQPRPGCKPTLEALDAHCRTQLAGYKVPRAVHAVERIQRQPSGKPDYPWAKRTATEALG
ncbi:MAG TPA: acyl-CoA synthetase [Longimicrobiales bacterium]|nr:acyl-CoA synthetase [Longimicrobiales bacterium]